LAAGSSIMNPPASKYSQRFFDSIEPGAARSAKVFAEIIYPLLRPRSVLDVGCGRGVWLRAWHDAGVPHCFGVDGHNVDIHGLWIPPTDFTARDLARPFDLERKFDLVQSLEVAEHLPPASAGDFVRSLVRHGDVVLFSAAVSGQIGVRHINEQPLEFWRGLFRAHRYAAFDVVRGLVQDRTAVEPWYRYNTILYANRQGQARLPAAFAAGAVPDTTVLREGGNVLWRVRRAIGSRLPRRTADWLADAKVAVTTGLARTSRSKKVQ
jgi:SAM-dependent methyltransferase